MARSTKRMDRGANDHKETKLKKKKLLLSKYMFSLWNFWYEKTKLMWIKEALPTITADAI